MSGPCEINELDTRKPELASALAEVGGFYYEGGVREYSEWAKVLRREVGQRVSDAALQSAWLDVKIEAMKTPEERPTRPIPKPTNFVEEVAKKLGKQGAASFLEAIADEDGEPVILQKLLDGVPLRPDEARLVRDAWSANYPKRLPTQKPQDTQNALSKLLQEVKPSKQYTVRAAKEMTEAQRLAKEAREARQDEARRQKYEAAEAARQSAKFYREEAARAERAEKRIAAEATRREAKIEADAQRALKKAEAQETRRQERMTKAQDAATARGERVRRLRVARKEARRLAQEQEAKTYPARLRERVQGKVEDMARTGKPAPVQSRQANPLLDVATAEYAKSAKSLEAWARGVEKRLGEELPQDVRESLFREAARRFAVENQPVERIRQEMGRKIDAEILKTRPTLYRKAQQLKDIKQKLIAIRATFDLSFFGRQGGKIVALRPIVGAKALAEGFRALRDPEIVAALDGEIKGEATAYGSATHWREIGLDFTLPFGEENAEGVGKDGPIWSLVKGLGLERTEEANRLILNRLRLEMFKSLVKPGDPLPYQKRMAEFVNILSSRADTKYGQKNITPILQAASDYLQVWSPRNNLANVQFLAGQTPVKAALASTMAPTAEARAAERKALAVSVREYARYGATVATLLGGVAALAKAMEWDWLQVELNPRSKDFGKVRVGNLELDFTTGWRKHLAFLVEMVGARQESAFDPGSEARDWREPDRGRIMAGYGRSMLNPLAGEAVTQFTGRDFKGSPVKVYGLQDDANGTPRPFLDPVQAAKRTLPQLMPISAAQWVEALMEQGLTSDMAKAMAAGMPFEFIGVGTSTRDRRPDAVSAGREKDAAMREGFTPASSAAGRLLNQQ